MKKTKKPVSLDDDVWDRLDEIGGPFGMTANTVIAAAACELSRIKSRNLWFALARIAEGEEEALAPVSSVNSRRKNTGGLPVVPEMPNPPQLTNSKRAKKGAAAALPVTEIKALGAS